MSEVKVGTEDLVTAIELASKNIILGFKIAKDGIDSSDLAYMPESFENVKELVAFISSKPHLADQIKDLDVLEGVALIKKGYDEYKKIAESIKE